MKSLAQLDLSRATLWIILLFGISPCLTKAWTNPVTNGPLTTGLLHISYDGAHCTGWSAANDSNTTVPKRRMSGRKRRRSMQPKGYVRSVEGILRLNLAKLYGNVDPQRIVVEGCSRTDKGVHATGMISQFYCLTETAVMDSDPVLTIPGKRLPHPMNATDVTLFEPLQMELTKIQYCLNRMLPDDVKIRRIAPVPTKRQIPFHPTLDAVSKTYEYTLSVGSMYDPTKWRRTWHVDSASGDFDVNAVHRVADLLQGKHDFSAFRGAPRGKDDRQRQQTENTICCLSSVAITDTTDTETFPGVALTTHKVVITGDRFLYKMMRFLVGALVAVGTQRLTYEDVERALATGSWIENGVQKQFMCAPAHGLTLSHVEYPGPIEWTTSSHRVSSV